MTPINPQQCIDYERSTEELHHFLLFCLLTAGKNADWAAKKAYEMVCSHEGPFFIWDSLSPMEWVERPFREHGTGQYDRLSRATLQLSILIRSMGGLQRVTCDALMKCHGLGPKTARMFSMFSSLRDRNKPWVILDAHILRWARDQGATQIPAASPSVGSYARVEARVMPYVASWGFWIYHGTRRSISFAEVNLELWKSIARGGPRAYSPAPSFRKSVM